MPIYWTLFFAPLIVRGIQVFLERHQKFLHDKRKNEKILVVIVFGLIIFFSGMRSFVADTVTYVAIYKSLPSNISNFRFETYSRDAMFYFLSCLFKSITKASFQPWLFIIALISGIAFGKAIYKYTRYKWLACYLFIAGTMFTYFINGMRQFIVMAILFCNIDLVINKKYIKFVILVMLMSYIHGSAWFFLPIILCDLFEPWSKGMIAIIIGCCIIGTFFNYFSGIMNSMLADTQYAGMGTKMAEGTGSSIIRVFVAAVPVVLSYIANNEGKLKDDKLLKLSANSSMMNMGMLIISSCSFGIFMGRVAAYYNMLNLIIYPWLVYNTFDKKTNSIMIVAFVLVYGLYFYYQMVVTWGGLPYVSQALGIAC